MILLLYKKSIPREDYCCTAVPTAVQKQQYRAVRITRCTLLLSEVVLRPHKHLTRTIAAVSSAGGMQDRTKCAQTKLRGTTIYPEAVVYTRKVKFESN